MVRETNRQANKWTDLTIYHILLKITFHEISDLCSGWWSHLETHNNYDGGALSRRVAEKRVSRVRSVDTEQYDFGFSKVFLKSWDLRNFASSTSFHEMQSGAPSTLQTYKLLFGKRYLNAIF